MCNKVPKCAQNHLSLSQNAPMCNKNMNAGKSQSDFQADSLNKVQKKFQSLRLKANLCFALHKQTKIWPVKLGSEIIVFF